MLSEAGATASARETTIKWTSVLKSLAYTGGHPLGQPIHEGIDLQLKGSLAQKEPCLWKHKVVACGSAQSTQPACPACSSQVSFPGCERLTQLLQQACSQAGHDNRMSAGTPAAAAAVQTLLPLSGCSQCWQHCSREHQRALGEAGAVQHLLQELKSLAPAQQQQQQQQHGTSAWDTLQALLFACCGHPSNLQQLVKSGAVQELAQVLRRPAGSSEVQLACGLLGEAAAAAAAAGQLSPGLEALQHAALQHKQQLLHSGNTAAACSSCCAIVWSSSKAAAAALCQRRDDGSNSGSGSSEQPSVLQSVAAAVEGTVLPVVAAAAKAAGAAAGGVRHNEQQQYGLLLMLCLSGCAQLLQLYEQQRLAHPMEPVDSVSVVEQAVQDALDALGHGRLRQVMQAYWDSQQQRDSRSSALQEQQHGLQHLSSCQFLSVLQQLHSSAEAASDSSSSSSLLRPMSGSCVPAGATATIEVVYAGSPASEKAPSSCDDKEYGLVTSSDGSKAKAHLSSSSSRERSPSDDSRGAGHPDTRDAAACRHAQQQQQLVDQPVDSQHNFQSKQQQSVQAPSDNQNVSVITAPVKTADSAPPERQPGMPQQSRSASSLCPIYADAEASSNSASVSTIGTLPPRSELCSSASSSSIQACGDGQSGTPAGTGKPEGAQARQGESPNGGNSSGDDANHGPGRGSDHTSGNSGSSGGGGGSGNSGGGSGDDDHHGDDGHDGPTCTSPPSDDTTATGTALSTSSDSIVLSPMAGISAAPSAAAAAAADAPVSLGCSASDPVIVPRPSALGALPGLMLRGSPASLCGAAGPMSGAAAGLGAPGTPPAGATSSSLGFSFPTNLASLNITGHNAPQAGLAGAGGCTPGALADVLLSPSAFGARGLMGQGGMQGQGSGAGLSGRRASDAGTLGGSSMLGGWSSGLNPTQGQTGQPGLMPVGSWPSAALGLGALEEHRQGQQQQRQQQQQQQQQQMMAAARSAGSDPAAERSGLSSYLHMLNPGLVGLIGSTDTAGTLGPVGGYTHLMSWLTEPASGLSSAGSGSTSAPTQSAAAAGLQSTGGVPGAPGRASAQASAAAAAGSSQAAGSLTSQSSTDLHPSGSSNSTGGDGTTDVRPQRDQRTPPAAPSSAAAAAGAAPGLPKPGAPGAPLAKVLSGHTGLGGEGQAAPAAAGGQLGLATAGSGSISSSGSLAGSSFSGMAHSYSGESLEDLDAIRMSSASFAAALAEAEAIAANVAASMQQHQQQQAANAAAAAAARSAAGPDAKLEGSSMQTDSTSGTSATDSAGDDESSGPAYDPAELTKGAPSRHLWLGNLHQRLPRSLLRSTFERFGPVEDVVTFPGRMYAFVNFREPADAAKAAQAVQDKEVPTITGNRRLVVKFRPSRRALGKVAEAMVPGLVDPASAANSDRGSGSMPCSHAGSYSNLAASAAAGSAAGHSRTSSNASLAVLQPGGSSSGALARVGSDASPTPDEAASVRSGGSSIAGASSSRDLARAGSAASHGSLSVPDLPPGLTPQPQQLQQQLEDAAGNRAFQAGGAAGGLSSAAAAAAAVAAAAAAVASGSSDSNAAAAAHVAAAAAALAAVDAGLPQGPGLSGSELSLGDDVDIPEGKPSRHLWLGNIPLKPNRGAMEALFSRFGPLESVRVFPGKTFAFVNFVQANHAIAAKAALDGQPSPVITGPKPMVIRFQKDHAGAPPGTAAAKALEVAAARARKAAAPRTSLTGGLGGLLSPTATGSLAGPAGLGGEEDLVAEPAVNLSNKLNPNNIHYDRELAARYKRMSKAEKEALWAQDRALQQLEQNPAAASLLSAAAAAAAAAAAGSGPSLSAFDHSGLQAHPAAAAAAASSLYSQLLANPQLAVALAAQGNTAAAAAAAAAGLLQSNHAALAGGASAPWSAMGAGALGAAGLGPGNAALAAAAAASGRMGGYYGQMAGLGGGDHMQNANLQQYLATGGLSNQVLQQALLQQQLANSYSGLPGTPQEQATLAAFSALDPSLLQTHLTSALGPHALGHRLSGLGSGLSMQGSGLSMQGSVPQQGQVGLPSTPSVGGAGVGGLLGMPPNSPGPSMGRYSSSGVGFGAGGGLRTNAPPRGSYTGSGLESAAAAAGAGAFQQFRASNSGSGLGGLGPIGPSAGPSGRDSLFMDYSQQQQQQQSGLLSPTWSGGGAFSGGGGQAPAPAPTPHRWPQQFMCPLSNQLMSDPVVAADGVTYQRDAITDWMRLRDVSPVTGRHLGSAVLQPDFQLRAAIASEVAKVQSSGGLM